VKGKEKDCYSRTTRY